MNLETNLETNVNNNLENNMDGFLYHYRAQVKAVYDGDTCTMDIDLGLGTWVHNEKIRLSRINAPELRGDDHAAGLLARDFLRDKIENQQVWISTLKDKKGKYGRYIADIWITDADDNAINVNDALVAAGHAQYVQY